MRAQQCSAIWRTTRPLFGPCLNGVLNWRLCRRIVRVFAYGGRNSPRPSGKPDCLSDHAPIHSDEVLIPCLAWVTCSLPERGRARTALRLLTAALLRRRRRQRSATLDHLGDSANYFGVRARDVIATVAALGGGGIQHRCRSGCTLPPHPR